MTDDRDYEDIVNSPWSASKLAAMALSWNYYDNCRKPVWTVISGTEADAREYYASLTSDPEALRSCAAEALAEAGWTIDRINYRKS